MEGKLLEEEMYWKHFHTMHFCLFLPSNFHDRLVLPAKFAEHMSSKLPQKMSLIGPSGAAWDVEVTKNGCLALIGDGWKGFTKAYELEENGLLLLKYKYDSSFEILIFDQKSLCEKEAAYFVKKCFEKKHDQKNGCKRSVSNVCSTEIMEDNDADGGSEFVSTKKRKKYVEEEVVCKGQRSNTETPKRCPSDASSEDHHNDPDFFVSNKSASQSAKKPTEKNTAVLLSEKSDMEQIPLLRNGQMEVTEGVISAIPSKLDISPDVFTKAVTLRNGKSHPKMTSTQKYGRRRGRLLKRAHPTSANRLAFGRANVAAEKPSGNNTSAELGPKSDTEQIPLRNGPMETEGVTLATLCKSDVPTDVILTKVVTPNNGKSHLETKSTQKPGSKSSGHVTQALPRSAKRLAFIAATEYISNRRAVTETEKLDAIERAGEALTEKSIMVVMRPTCCYKRFYLNIPAEWMHKHLPRHQKEVILRVGEKTWLATFRYYGQRSYGGLTAGWKKFALENNLEEYDVCVFKLASEKDDVVVVFDVEIFRVVEEISPLSSGKC